MLPWKTCFAQTGKRQACLEFLAFCFEWRDYLEGERNRTPYHSRLPVGMDGTCNGFQHFAALLRDQELAEWTNVAPGPLPADLYSLVARWVGEAINNDQREELLDAKRDYLEVVERKLAKAVVMIIPYGASHRGIEHSVRVNISSNWASTSHGPSSMAAKRRWNGRIAQRNT